MYDIICDIKCNYILSIDKKCEFCNCTLIMKFHERLDIKINNNYNDISEIKIENSLKLENYLFE